MKEYLAWRVAAEKLITKIPADYPCSRCNTSECCQNRKVRLTFFDAQYILEAIKNGEISKKVAEQAWETAKDRNSRICPFLNSETNKCTIYNHRPLVCMTYGYGHIPNQEEMERSFRILKLTKKDLGVQIKSGEVHMCENSAQELINTSRRMPLGIMMNFSLQKTYLAGFDGGKMKMRLGDFARNVLLNNHASQRVLRSGKFI